MTPRQKRAAVAAVVSLGMATRRRACRVLRLSRSTAYYRSEAAPEKLAQEGLVEAVSREHPAWGYRKVTAVLRAEHGEAINAKRVARLRRMRGLAASRRRAKKRRVTPSQAARQSARQRDEVWSYDFISDALVNGRSVRILSVIDEYTRECVALRAALSFPARRVIDTLEETLICQGRKPQWLRSDNGPEFIAQRVQEWLGQAQVGPCYITPGSPWENGHVESFHASLRAELLDRELFVSVGEVNALLEQWREHYNEQRPHGSLGYRSPAQFAKRELPLRPTACAPVPAGQVAQTN